MMILKSHHHLGIIRRLHARHRDIHMIKNDPNKILNSESHWAVCMHSCLKWFYMPYTWWYSCADIKTWLRWILLIAFHIAVIAVIPHVHDVPVANVTFWAFVAGRRRGGGGGWHSFPLTTGVPRGTSYTVKQQGEDYNPIQGQKNSFAVKRSINSFICIL